ncbi:MAG: substrate-binding domain-containing protein [Kiritimatiellae bacterium]|nr:substrate-binding domain-containing protein [Kiritimatiellia bacterium]
MNKRTTAKIVLALDLAQASWRDFFAGFLESVGSDTPLWSVRIADPQDFTPARIDELEREGVDGIVIGDISDEAADRLAASTIALVVIGSQATSLAKRTLNIVNVHNDDEDIGRMGADALVELGNFGTFGFIPKGGSVYWSNLREKGFKSQITRMRRTAKVYHSPFDDGSHEDMLRLSKWLTAIEKPAALMAAYDVRALHVLEACRNEGFSIPGQICILGVDNDRLLCESAKPTLSSVAPDHRGEGVLAADQLAKLLRQKSKRAKSVLCSSKTVIERESTAPVSPARALILRALAYIDAHATDDITVLDVVRHLGVSRSLAELRFRQFHSSTIAQAIRERRLGEVCKRLARTRRSITTISKECSFKNANHLKNIFRVRFGMSMREFRNTKISAQTTVR